jgi:uncharacterized cupredoxin-like copper-binding protein
MRRLLVAVSALAVVPLLACGEAATPTPQPETRVEVALVEFGLEPTVLVSGPGETAFFVTNHGAIEHELVVIRTDRPASELVVVNGQVDLASAGVVKGKIGTNDLQPGASGFLSLDLEPGMYALICNIPGHYEAGMSAGLTLAN